MFTQIGTVKPEFHCGFRDSGFTSGTYPLLAYVDPNGVVIAETIHANMKNISGEIQKVKIYQNWIINPMPYAKLACRLGEGFVIRYKSKKNSRGKSRTLTHIVRK